MRWKNLLAAYERRQIPSPITDNLHRSSSTFFSLFFVFPLLACALSSHMQITSCFPSLVFLSQILFFLKKPANFRWKLQRNSVKIQNSDGKRSWWKFHRKFENLTESVGYSIGNWRQVWGPVFRCFFLRDRYHFYSAGLSPILDWIMNRPTDWCAPTSCLSWQKPLSHHHLLDPPYRSDLRAFSPWNT